MPLDKLNGPRPLVRPDAPTLRPLGRVEEKPDEGSVGSKIAGGAALAGSALLAAKFGKLKPALEKINAVRQQLMLSGFALPKSILGNAGAMVERSIDTKSLAPIKEFLSRQTLDDAVNAYKTNTGPVGAQAGFKGVTLPGPTPGRVMGAFDEAAQGALKRSGASADEAQNAVLQSPLSGPLAEALDSPMARYIHPFRRTPFNQFIEGLKRLPGAEGGTTHGKAIYGGVGAAHGALTADDATPVSLPLAMAGASRYGFTYGGAAMIARALAEGKGDGGVPGGMLPVSEYGLSQTLTEPQRPFIKPAAFTALEKLTR